MRDVLSCLLNRHSVGPKWLVPPGPDRTALRIAAQAAMRAPDHGSLRPFRFAVVADRRRPALADLFADFARRAGASASEIDAERERAYNGPTLVAVIARIVPDHEKVPAIEQWVCVGGALSNFVNALHLLGFGAKVLSGRKVTDPSVREAFCGEGESLVGWVLAGTASRAARARGADDPDSLLGDW